MPDEFKHIPTFSNFFRIEDAVLKMYLNDDGLQALSRIMWVISNFNTSILYSPIIVNLASLLLIYLNEEETYEILTKMIRNSKTSIISNYFTLNQNDFGKLVGMISKIIKQKRPDLGESFSNICTTLEECISYIINSFGIGYFPFTFLSRVLSIFITERNKGLIKIVATLFIIYADKLMSYTSGDIKNHLISTFQAISYPDQIIVTAFKMKLKKFNLDDITQ